MSPKPWQSFGGFALVVLGGLLALRLTQAPEQQSREGSLAAYPSVSATGEAPPDNPIPPPSPEAPVPPPLQAAVEPPAQAPAPAASAPADSMPGSQDARDDLYCWAVLGKEFDARIKADPPAAARLLDAAKRLEASGVRKLEAEGVTRLDDWASLTVAFAEKARADHRGNALRIPVDACLKRAE